MNFAKELIRLLEARGLKTRQQKADFCDCSYAYMQFIEEGKKIPAEETIVGIVKKFGFSPAKEMDTAKELLLLAATGRAKGATKAAWESISGNQKVDDKIIRLKTDETKTLNRAVMLDAIRIINQIIKLNSFVLSDDNYADVVSNFYAMLLAELRDAEEIKKKSAAHKLIANTI